MAQPSRNQIFGLRREAKRHAAFARASVARTNSDDHALESGVAAALCHRNPKSLPPATILAESTAKTRSAAAGVRQ